MHRTEFHCHTSYSKDCLLTPRDLVRCAVRKNIDRVVVTDHNTIGGATEAQQIDPGRIIVGEEIMTTGGELLAAFVTQEIPPGLSPHDAVERLRAQDAFISVSHPFDTHRRGGWRLPDLLDIAPLVDAIETYNSRCIEPAHNRKALEFAQQHELAGTVGSDAHTCWELGRSVLELPPFDGAEALRRVVRLGSGRLRWSPPWIHLTSRYAVFRKRLIRRLDTAPGE